MPVTRPPKALPSIFIPKTKVNALVKEFDQKKRPLLETAIAKEETRAIWYSLEHFEEIMRELYYLNADGVRVYFGAYGPESGKYAGQLSIVFVPTYSVGPNTHRDVVMEEEENYKERSEVPPAKNLNFGALCKPDCDGQELVYPNDSF
ncbi:MAG: hypothetical protein NTW29_04940 [Bacteroidetes bacterium]|nr:hypothetical protein [Bacteroidota bacterium]